VRETKGHLMTKEGSVSGRRNVSPRMRKYPCEEKQKTKKEGYSRLEPATYESDNEKKKKSEEGTLVQRKKTL